MRLWVIAALIAAGLVVGTFATGAFTGWFQYATFQVFLPAIIFEAAWQLDLRIMRRSWRPIVLLAIPGVAVTAAAIAAIAYYGAHLRLPAALILGAVLSATDPVAVTAIFRRLQVPAVLATIVESESLLNDAVAVVLYRTVIGAVTLAAAAQDRVLPLAWHAALGSALALALGAAFGYFGSLALRRYVPVPLQLVATFASAYAAYLLANALGWSGIFAVISCAIVMRELERSYASVGMEASVERAWHVAANLSNAALFFLIGTAVQPANLWPLRDVLGWTLLAVLASRVIVAYGLLRLVPRIARSWMTVVRLAGVRGAISLALALSVPASIPQRDVIVDATFAVVVVTLVIGSLTYGKRIALLDLGAG